MKTVFEHRPMKHDIFISYQTESIEFVRQLAETLERNGVSCWYGHRNIISNHAAEIPQAIRDCKIFLLIVDENVATHPRNDILNEVYLACERFKRGELDMMPVNITKSEYINDELIYHVGRLQKKFIIDSVLPEGASSLIEEVLSRLGKNTKLMDSYEGSHYKNDYFSINNDFERNRLKIQQKLLRNFDGDVYKKLIAGKRGLNILDIGCNEGDLIYDRYGECPEVNKIIGIDINADAIASACMKYESNKVQFYVINAEDADFGYEIAEVKEMNEIDKFDIIHISMLLLHIERPDKLLKRIRALLAKNGKLFIRDIDDTLTFVYPDPVGGFRRMIEICAREALSGYRHSGKGIYTMLVQNGYKNICIEKKGLDSAGMTPEEKDALFNTYFSFIYDDTKFLHDNNPNDRQVADDYNWLESNFVSLKKHYDMPETLFQLGFITITAEK